MKRVLYISKFNPDLHQFLVVICMLVIGLGYSQEVNFSVDRDTLQIGEQIDYSIQVEKVSPEDIVVFPKDQTFVPLEMVEAYEIDTLDPKTKTFTLTKAYKLTQFDSGTYAVPPQLVKINDKAFYTDTMTIRVNDVVLDTTKQKLYPIKPSIGVEKPFALPSWFWWALISLVAVAFLAYLIFKQKKKRDEAKRRLPPFEQAMLSLRELDKSSALDTRDFKAYISDLTYITRRYLEEKLEIRALEYTTNELVSELKFKKERKKLTLKDEMISAYETLLSRADLAKFANRKPDIITLKSDRKQVEKFLKHVQSAIPQVTEEEKKKDQAFQEALAKKRKKQKWIVGVILGLGLLAVSISALVATKGYDYVVDNVFGNPTKELLEGEWYTSDYGVPPLSLTTPDVLVRGELELPEGMSQNVKSSASYSYGSLYQNLYVTLNQIQLKETQDIDLDAIVDNIYSNLEERGAYNIITKSEDFETLGGVDGKKVFGSFSIENPITKKDIKKEYQIVNFGKGGFQQIIIFYDGNDENGEKIASRILNAVEFKTLGQ